MIFQLQKNAMESHIIITKIKQKKTSHASEEKEMKRTENKTENALFFSFIEISFVVLRKSVLASNAQIIMSNLFVALE